MSTSLSVRIPRSDEIDITDHYAGLSGSVSPVYAPGMTLSRAGVVAGLDMTTEAALTKLSYLLALPNASPQSVARDMSISLRGELTEYSRTVFRHPDDALPGDSALYAERNIQKLAGIEIDEAVNGNNATANGVNGRS